MHQINNWQIRWLGHDGFQLVNPPTTLYIDPYQVMSGQPADLILYTHEHYDHFDPQSWQNLTKESTTTIGPKAVTDQLEGQSNLISLQPNETYSLKLDDHLTKVTAVAAYNINKSFHPKQDQKLGYILELEGKRIYYAGDTDLIPEMSQLGPIDLAMLPVSGTYVMTAAEAIEAAKIIRPATAIPMHYGSIIGSITDAEEFAVGTNNICQTIVLTKEPAV